MIRLSFLVLTLVLLAAPSFAGDSLDCRNAMTQRDMNECASNDYSRADARLNGTYRRLMDMLDAGQRSKMIQTQRAWITYRDRRCRSETAESEGGSMHPMLYAGCLTEMTNARTKELLADIECQRHGEKCHD